MKKYKVGILGATGMVGQYYISLLKNHPWFKVNFVTASEKSSGKLYKNAVEGRWHLQQPLYDEVANLNIYPVDAIEIAKKSCDFVFSALDKQIAFTIEEIYAHHGIPVVSNASAYRQSNDVPVIIPEINPYHLEIIPIQQKKRGWKKGFIVTKPNCSLQSYLLPIYAIHREFPVQKVMITTLQAVSGAGYPGLSSLDLIDNIIPNLIDEEKKSENEPLKILGSIHNGEIVNSEDIIISAHCTRVPVIDGHLACVSVKFKMKPSLQKIISLWENFQGEPQKLRLPSAPKKPIYYINEPQRPQPRIDRMIENGMSISVGCLQECSILDYKFVGLSHNLIRGAAGGGILNAELLVKKGYIKHHK